MKSHNNLALAPNAGADLSTESDQSVLKFCEHELNAALAAEPSVEADLDDMPVHICSASEFADMIRKTQNPALRMHLFAVYQYREHLAIRAGLPFGFRVTHGTLS